VPTSLPDLATELQALLTTAAARAAAESAFVRRRRALDGPSFVQGLVFGWLDRPAATLEDLLAAVADAGADLTAQALDQRFTAAAADCLRRVLAAAVARVVAADPPAQPLLERFCGVYLLDSTTVALPAALAGLWPGCGGSTAAAGKAALKAQVRWEVRSGTLEGLALSAGRGADAAAGLATAALPAGSLRLADLGYFDLRALAGYGRAGVFWLSRVPGGTRLYDAAGRKWEPGTFLKQQGGDRVDVPVLLGAEERLPCRLLAARVPAAVAADRRARARKQAAKSGHRLSAERLALCDWTVVATNLPAEKATLAEALVLLGVRWRVELLFKSWKSAGLGLAASRSRKAWRVLCEVYAKLLAAVVRQWAVVAAGGGGVHTSVARTGRAVQRLARALADALPDPAAVAAVLGRLARAFRRCRVNRRGGRPSMHQKLAAPLLLELT
jgi:hypothetical protein